MNASRTTVLLVLGLVSQVMGAGPTVNESARQIPVAYQVDVAVIGGSSGAVSAAVAAAGTGSKVFLAAPRPYLGDDMTATLRLWLEDGEVPAAGLAQRIFADQPAAQGNPDPNRLEFTYTADAPSATRHRDTNPPSLLCDGIWGNSAQQSVEFAGDVTLTLDLKKPQPLATVRVMVYDRGSGKDSFRVQSVAVSASADQKTWTAGPVLNNDRVAEATAGQGGDPCITLSAPLSGTARYLKLAVKRGADAQRIILGEIEVVGPADAKPAQPAAAPRRIPRPLHVKKTLEDSLLAAGVEFLYSSYPTDVLRDDAGRVCGFVMANRAGRQAVLAKTVIDATERAAVARMAGAAFRPYPSGVHAFQRVVIGGEPQSAPAMTVREIEPPFRGAFPTGKPAKGAKTAGGPYRIFEYSLKLPMKDDSPGAWAAADQKARSMTYHEDQQFTSDLLFEVPPDSVSGEVTAAEQSVAELPLGSFRPKKVPYVWLLGGCADVSRAQAEKLLRPVALIETGTRIGTAAAEEATKRPALASPKLPGQPAAAPSAQGDTREALVGVRPTQSLPTVAQEARTLPVLGKYDVVVIGGGTGGAPAGIAAARQGAKTLVVEYLSGLGGVGTVGAISNYYWGNRVGFTKEIEDGKTSWIIEQRMEWYRDKLRAAGGEVWFGAMGCGAFVDGSNVAGVVVATPQGRGVVLANTVIDATGNADIAAAAGAACTYTDHTEFALQGTGLPPRQLGASYTNTDFTFADETDMVDVTRMFIQGKDKYPGAFDQGQLIDTRERRRIVGELTVTLLDQINDRTFPDSIVRCRSNFDTHGYTLDPYLLLEHPEHKGFPCYVPYRSLLPKGYEGILVTGLGVSAHRDAIPLIRMQPDIQNQGYAAGVAAAMASKAGVSLRQIDIRTLQKHLVEIGNLPDSVLTEEDSYPLPKEKILEAVKSFGGEEPRGAAVILSHPDQALPMLKEAFASSQGKAKVAYAKALAMLGDASGVDVLVEEVERTAEWDKGWNFRGMGQFGSSMSPLDGLLVALGRTRQTKTVPAILRKVALLSEKSEFSHHRAAALALELLGDPRGAKPLADLLAQPGMTGYAHSSLAKARELEKASPGGSADESRRVSLRELVVARALYRLGDHEGVGKKILTEYSQDLRGHLARHAQAVLKGESSPRK